ncbi:MAG: hypothetical protein P8L18_11705 [Verrucomicrobiota bacterium]|nr:hypothetical protein [Verrucomicrobiota bacterium]MDG1891966.1 hypothetical protein [Verrucomicrobiota bacterium]
MFRAILLMAGFALSHVALTETLQSRSGQFLVSWVKDFAYTPRPNALERSQGMVALTPELIALTAEQTKDAVLQALGVRDTWRHKIRITLSTRQGVQAPFIAIPMRYSDGWGYRVLLKPKIEEDAWIKHLIHVILLEIVNRPSPEKMCDPPAWLVEGMRAYVVHSAIVDPSLTVEDMVVVGAENRQLGNPVPSFLKRESTFQAKAFFRSNSPLSAAQLFQADVATQTTPGFRHGAHLMFRELCLMPQGKVSMIRFIEMMPRFLNWQTAFHKSHQDTFPNMLGLEKWWAVLTASITQYNEGRRWNMKRSLDELGRILNPPAKIATDPGTLPQWQTVPFKEVIASWGAEERSLQIKHFTRQLEILKANSLFEVVPVIEGYLEWMQGFGDALGRVGFDPLQRGQLVLREGQIIRRATEQLERLEQERLRVLAIYQAMELRKDGVITP